MRTQRTGRTQAVLSENVRNRMDVRYKDVSTISGKIAALASESRVGRSTIQRIIDPDTYGDHRTSVDIVESLALALRVEPYQLIVDYTIHKDLPKIV